MTPQNYGYFADDDDYDPMDSGVERLPDPRFVEHERYRVALERIAGLSDATTEAIQIAKEALGLQPPAAIAAPAQEPHQ